MGLADRRADYDTTGLLEAEVAADPIAQWWAWYDAAVAAGVTEPNAMVVATVDEAGRPDARTVLVRGVDERGFAFYTNLESAKSRQLAAAPEAAAVFGWLAMHRQVRVRGPVHAVEDGTADAYFASRPRASQVGAWASRQSEVIASRAVLDDAVDAIEARFEGADVTRPPYWGGWRIEPVEMEFWQGRPNRLHDRLRYRRTADTWLLDRLSP